MRRLSEKSVASLDSLLADAAHVVREHAAEHSYRATAMKAIRERLLHRYHTDHATSLLGLADSLSEARTYLAGTAKAPASPRLSAPAPQRRRALPSARAAGADGAGVQPRPQRRKGTAA